ncbi:MAG: hypothetical protein WA051_01055 [Minisyncoccia bacterium]
MLNEILKNGLNHSRAYLIRGEKENIISTIFDAIEKEWGIVAQGNPNILTINGHLNVDDTRSLIEFASMSPFGDSTIKVIILNTERITREAQNTLLKLTEEPNQSLRIFVIIPKDVELLPTLLSRLEDISYAVPSASSGQVKTDASNFLAMGLKERFKLAEKIAKDEDDTTLDVFLRDLEKKVYKQKYKDEFEKKKAFSAIVFAKESSGFQSRPKKMILEALAISLPTI